MCSLRSRRFRVGVEQQARRANAMIGFGDAERHQATAKESDPSVYSAYCVVVPRPAKPRGGLPEEHEYYTKLSPISAKGYVQFFSRELTSTFV